MRLKVNFIQHYKGITERFIDDNTINPNEIALYHALFSIWNQLGFQDEFTIYRDQLKIMAGISSNNTYSKTLQSLHNKGYIKYTPSQNWHKGSKVMLLKIDTNGDTNDDTNDDTIADTNDDTNGGQHAIPMVIPMVIPMDDTYHKHINKETLNPETLKTPSNLQTPKEDGLGNGIYFCKDGRTFDLNNINYSKWRDNDGFEFLQSIGKIVGLKGTNLPGLHDAVKHLIETDHKIGDLKKFFITMLTNHLKDCGL